MYKGLLELQETNSVKVVNELLGNEKSTWKLMLVFQCAGEVKYVLGRYEKL